MNINELEAGPEMDVCIHTEIMGYPRNWPLMLDPKYLYEQCLGGWIKIDPPPYSRDIAAADLVVDKMGEMGFSFNMRSVVPSSDPSVYIAHFGDRRKKATEFTRPLAICRAALMATEAE